MKTALITGITGQDGSYLSEFLLGRDYQVHGIVRRASTFNTQRLDSIYEDPHNKGARLHLHYGDVTDGTGLRRILEKVAPEKHSSRSCISMHSVCLIFKWVDGVTTVT